MAREDIDYKEYSRLRDIAHKRVVRMEKAGYDVNIQLPTVKQVRASENPYWFLREMRKFVEGATTLGAVRATGSPTLPAEIRPHFPKVPEIQPETEIQKRQRKREQARRSRQRRKIQEIAPEGKKEKYLSYIKAIQTMGEKWLAAGQLSGDIELLQNAKFLLNMTAGQAASFVEYAEYRFSQSDFLTKYAFKLFTEDFADLWNKKGSVTNLERDFERFLADQKQFKVNAGKVDTTGISFKDMMNLWAKFIGKERKEY